MSLPDMVGKRFGQLSVILYAGEADRWICFCACRGDSVTVEGADLRGSHIRSCGCQRESRQLVEGDTCGRLLVVAHREGDAWECECACGKTVNVLAYNLRTAASQSCGRCAA